MIKITPSRSRPLRFPHCIRKLVAANNGVVAIIFALSLIPLVLSIGLAVDLGRAYIVKQRLIRTTDAAGLAIGASITTSSTTEELETVLDNYFAANFPDSELGTVTSTSFTFDGTKITVTAEADVETTFMRIANFNTISVNANSEITRQEESLELVMVLDNTGSMSTNDKIGSLKTASLSLLDILFGDDTEPANIKIALVPFAGTVNLGTSNTDLVTDASGWNGCVKALADPDDTLDDSSGPWEPLASGGGFFFFSSSCPEALTPLTNVKSTLTTGINAMSANGRTHINFGAVWGWRVISPNSPFTEGVAFGTPDSTKAMIILTDGENFASSSSTAYADDPQSSADLDTKLTTVCTNIKDEGIIVYTITFDLSDAGIQALFEDCATDTSKFFNSPTSAELNRAFRAIAAELKRLHVSS
jgi:Flp pilus assembly protein TadG